MSLPSRNSSQAQPEPNRVVAAWLNFVLKSAKLPNALLDGVRQIALGLASSAFLHDLPEHRVIHVAAAVVAHGGADVFRNFVDLRRAVAPPKGSAGQPGPSSALFRFVT